MAKYTPIKISYKEFEPAGGSDENLSPVIFLHGSTCAKEMWGDIPQIIADKTKRKGYTYDARNHGDSESTEHYNFDLNVDDLFSFMDTLNISKAVLVGHSMGSLTATNAALRHPQRVELVFSEDMFIKQIPKKFLDSISGYILAFSEAVQSIPSDLEESEAIKHVVDILYEKYKESSQLSSEEGLRKTKLSIKRGADGGYEVGFNKDSLIKAFSDPDSLVTSPSGQFDGPIYFIYGSISPFNVGSEEEHIKQHFPKAEFIEFEGASHNVHVEFPEKFIQTILDRLQQ